MDDSNIKQVMDEDDVVFEDYTKIHDPGTYVVIDKETRDAHFVVRITPLDQLDPIVRSNLAEILVDLVKYSKLYHQNKCNGPAKVSGSGKMFARGFRQEFTDHTLPYSADIGEYIKKNGGETPEEEKQRRDMDYHIHDLYGQL